MGVSLDTIDGRTSLRFDIQPTANPTQANVRAEKLANPGFGRVFTDHMAVVNYNQAKGWHGARVASRANFPLDPATAVLHYAQEIFEGLKAYKRDDGGVNLFRPDGRTFLSTGAFGNGAYAFTPDGRFACTGDGCRMLRCRVNGRSEPADHPACRSLRRDGFSIDQELGRPPE